MVSRPRFLGGKGKAVNTVKVKDPELGTNVKALADKFEHFRVTAVSYLQKINNQFATDYNVMTKEEMDIKALIIGDTKLQDKIKKIEELLANEATIVLKHLGTAKKRLIYFRDKHNTKKAGTPTYIPGDANYDQVVAGLTTMQTTLTAATSKMVKLRKDLNDLKGEIESHIITLTNDYKTLEAEHTTMKSNMTVTAAAVKLLTPSNTPTIAYITEANLKTVQLDLGKLAGLIEHEKGKFDEIRNHQNKLKTLFSDVESKILAIEKELDELRKDIGNAIFISMQITKLLK